jgi:hypothetical protein
VLQSGSNADLRALVSPLSLAAGTYWLAFHNGPLTTTFRAEWYWAAADDLFGIGIAATARRGIWRRR